MSLLSDLKTSRGPAAAFASIGLFWGSFAALMPQVKSRAGLSDSELGIVLLVATSGAVLAMWLAPAAEKKLGARVLPILVGILALTALLPGHAPGGYSLAVALFAVGVASGTLDVAMNAQVSALEMHHRRPLMNLNHAVFSFAYAFSALAAGQAREATFSPAWVFSGVAVAILPLIVVTYRNGFSVSDHAATDEAAVPLAPRLLLLGGAIIMIAFMAEQATEGWSALHLERNLGAGAALGALGPTILGLTMAVGRLGGQFVSRVASEATAITWAAAVSGAGAVTAAMAPNLTVAYAGFAILGAGVSIVAPMAFAWIGRLVPNRYRSHAISRISVVGYAGFFIGPPLMGFLSEWFGLSASFLAIGLCLVLVPVVIVPLLRRSTRAL